ncbi:hypothetical protein EG329_014488 [Mollisiaceae sp. DMI_Dod_QoI]|nr:hypothetical protein EG329_014488 [Helotiales sp. DMI_Dod_QoI]
MALYKRATMPYVEQRQLERQQFNSINREERMWQKAQQDSFKEICKEYATARAQQILNATAIIDLPYVKLSAIDVAYIFCEAFFDDRRDIIRFSLTTRTVQTYVQCICRYVNSRRAPPDTPSNLPSNAKDRGRTPLPSSSSKPTIRQKSRSRSPVSGADRYGYRQRDPIEPARKPTPKSCAMISDRDFECILAGLTPAGRQWEVGRILNGIDCNGSNFMALDYLFIPYYDEGREHFFLMGIAPKQKFCFVIDSCPWDYPIDEDPARGLREIIIHQSSERAASSWPIYGQWQKRTRTDDGSPDAPQQRDGFNCGVFTVTNAFCLAFGYDILCYNGFDLIDLKRPRILAELRNGGFGENGKYDYPLLDLPGNDYTLFDSSLRADKYYKIRNLLPGGGQGGGNDIGGGAGGGENSDGSMSPPANTNITQDDIDMDDEHDDDDEQRGLRSQGGSTSGYGRVGKLRNPKKLTKCELTALLAKLGNHKSCKHRDKGSDSSSESEGADYEASGSDNDDSDVGREQGDNPPHPILTANQTFDAARLLLDGPNCDAKTAYLRKLKEIDDHPWPVQFDKYHHQKAGFIYTNVSLSTDRGEVPQFTRKFLRDGCRKFPIKGVERWRKEPMAAVNRWAESEMSAFMARALDEVETKPYPGVGRGYEEWKAQLTTRLSTTGTSADYIGCSDEE